MLNRISHRVIIQRCHPSYVWSWHLHLLPPRVTSSDTLSYNLLKGFFLVIQTSHQPHKSSQPRALSGLQCKLKNCNILYACSAHGHGGNRTQGSLLEGRQVLYACTHTSAYNLLQNGNKCMAPPPPFATMQMVWEPFKPATEPTRARSWWRQLVVVLNSISHSPIQSTARDHLDYGDNRTGRWCQHSLAALCVVWGLAAAGSTASACLLGAWGKLERGNKHSSLGWSNRTQNPFALWPPTKRVPSSSSW